AKATGFDAQHCDVGRGAWGEMAQVRALDDVGRIPGGEPDHLVNAHPQRQELAHHVEHVLHGVHHAAEVQVRGDAVRLDAGLHQGNRDVPHEAAVAVAHVEDDAALARLDEAGVG